MRRLLFAALSATLASGIGVATAATVSTAAASAPAAGPATCLYIQNPTVEYVWSKVCHF